MRFLLMLAAVAVLAFPGAATAQLWSDNFDSYSPGGLIGQGGWEGWDGSVIPDANVTAQIARSAPHSAEILPTSDVVQQFAGANSGQWVISGYNFIPDGSTGEQYFILLNTYNTGGGAKNWSTQVLFDSSAGLVVSQVENLTLPLIHNQWVEVRVEIDLDTDQQDIYYNNQLLSQKSWTEGLSGGGAANVAALDLFSNGGSSIFWDDLDLREGGPVPVESTSWGRIKSSFQDR